MHHLKTSALAAACAATTLAVTAPAMAHDHRYHPEVRQQIVTVSCYRGPWEDVIWDRPNPIFTDSLVNAGYSFSEAHAIAERICRDPSAVGEPERLRIMTRDLLAANPPAR